MRSWKGYIKGFSGFTTIELLVAIAIIGIMAAVAIPTFAMWLPNYRLKSAAMDLYGNMQSAKLRAIRGNGDCNVVFLAGSYQIQSPDGALQTVQLSSYGDGIRFGCGNAVSDWNGTAITESDRITYASNQAEFTSRGMSNEGTIYIDNSKNAKAYAITTLATGFVRVRVWDGTAWQ